jgi:PAS domain S-box-containing protein
MNEIRPAAINQETPEKFLNALAENYLLQDAILNATDLAVISTKYDGTITSFNRAAEPMIGYTALELIGNYKLSFFHDPLELEARKKALHSVGIEANTPDEILVAKAKLKMTDRREWTYRRSDGTLFPVTLSVSGIWNEIGELMGFLAIATDITEQREAEIERAKSERKFKMLAENIQGTVYLCHNDEFFTTVYLNDQVEALTGYSANEFLERKIDFVQLFHPDDKAIILEKIEHAILIHEGFHLQYRLLHRSGEWKWVDEVGIGIYENKKMVMLEGFLTDITDQKKDEQALILSKINLEATTQELRNQNYQLNEFAHIISHNLRSPVGNIGALVSLLDHESTIADYQAIFEKLKLASVNLQDTLNDLMETLMIKEVSQAERTLLDLEEVFQRIKEGFAGDIIKYDAHITYDFSRCPTINYSKTYLESIFLNLLSNAIKYRSPRRSLEVRIKTFTKDGKSYLVVEDNAQGIDLKKHGDQLFNLRKTFHEHKDARGVGLFLTKTQIEAMGGTITAESEVDKGSRFTVTFS